MPERGSSYFVVSPLVIVVYLSILWLKFHAVVGSLSCEQEYNLGYDVQKEHLSYVVVHIERLLYSVSLILAHIFHVG